MKIQKRRRRENKTDYSKRLRLLKGNRPRLIFRKTNKYIILQYIISKEAQDKVEFGISSLVLLNYGWPKEFLGSLKSIPASYLTGFLMGKKILSKKFQEPIIDAGMIKKVRGGRFFSFIKGIIDSGIKIKCDEKNLPSDDKIKGKYLKKDFSNFFEKVKLEISSKTKA